MISGKGPQEIADSAAHRARRTRLGKQVVVGGAGPTLQPERCFSMADYVVAGEAEPCCRSSLADLERASRPGVYHSKMPADLAKSPVPRYDLAKLDQYIFVGMNFTRGCPFACEFCAQIEIFGRKPRAKSRRRRSSPSTRRSTTSATAGRSTSATTT